LGVEGHVNQKTISRDVERIGDIYKTMKDLKTIKNKVEPWIFVAISKNCIDGKSWDYMMADVVNSLEYVPEGVKRFVIPAGKYAVFKIKPKLSFLWGYTIGMTKRYVYTKWFKESAFIHENSFLDDFEYHDYRSIITNPEIDLYVPVK